MDPDVDVDNLADTGEPEEKFELSPDQATSMGNKGGAKPGLFNRKRALIAITVSLSVIICGGFIFNTFKTSSVKSANTEERESSVSGNQAEFLSSLQRSAVRKRVNEEQSQAASQNASQDSPAPAREEEPLLPPVTIITPSPEVESLQRTPQPPPVYQAPPQNQQVRGQPSQQQQEPTHYRSPLVPAVQGSLFSQQVQPQAPPPAASSPGLDYFNNSSRNASPASYYGSQALPQYDSQNSQDNKQSFYNSSGGGAVYAGQYIGDNALWTGVVIPGVLETAINTDLPGNVLARVTQNVYDSKTGRNLLIPQGTLLIARYNSSVSYAQHRVQIVWDTLIRPDGYQIDLDGANGVDQRGMAGQDAVYNEKWFEYIKAFGIITMFSIANSKMAETAAQYASEGAASNIAANNSDAVNQLGASIIGRAMNIQPTLTVDNGTRVNIMLNKVVYLPPVSAYPATQKYILE